MVMKWVLRCYKKWSGLKINFCKSSLCFLGEVLVNNFLISLLLNYPVKMPPITYLDCHFLLGDLRRYIRDLSWKEFRRD